MIDVVFFSSAPSHLGVIFIFHPEEQSHIAHADSEIRPTATRSLALFKSVKIRFLRVIRVLLLPMIIESICFAILTLPNSPYQS